MSTTDSLLLIIIILLSALFANLIYLGYSIMLISYTLSSVNRQIGKQGELIKLVVLKVDEINGKLNLK